MNALLLESLDRTLRLMRDDVVDDVSDGELLIALTDTEVVLAGDAQNLSTHAAQSAYIAAALLMARSGHRVYLAAPDARLRGPQPPLKGDRLVSALRDAGVDLLPGIGFVNGSPRKPAALCVCFGDSPQRYDAQRVISVNASAWTASLTSASSGTPWMEGDWPCGALAAGAMAAVEAFKTAMHRLQPFARDSSHFERQFSFSENAQFELAPGHTPRTSALDAVDFISGGAISNSTLFTFARLLNVTGKIRVVEPECSDLSNLNRYMLLRRSAVEQPKGPMLSLLMPQGLELQAIEARYEGGRMPQLGDFAPAVLVGADEIPVRWKVQAQNPSWLGVGATSHWNAMASYHASPLGCAHCLHPRDEVTHGPLPTVAFVSFFAGLMLGCYFIRMRSGEDVTLSEQYTYHTPFRPEGIWRSPVARRETCPTCNATGAAQAA